MSERGSVLIVNGNGGFEGVDAYGTVLRAHGLHVQDFDQTKGELSQLDSSHPDVVVAETVFHETNAGGPGLIRELRSRLDDETSIIIVSERARREDREQARAAGADCLLVKPVLSNTLLYEVLRAVELRQSGRRLPWNWSAPPAPSTDDPGRPKQFRAPPPAAEAVAARAFDHFLSRGAEHGHDVEDWLRAEGELARIHAPSDD